MVEVDLDTIGRNVAFVVVEAVLLLFSPLSQRRRRTKFLSMNQLLLLPLLFALCFAAPTPTPNVSADFTANVTLVESGLTYHGYIMSDVTGHRYFRYLEELNETTYEFQVFGSAMKYTYIIMNSGCTCSVQNGGTISSPFDSLVVATASTKACNGTSGSLFVNDDFTALPPVPQNSFCVDGTTPKYIAEANRVTTYTNFVAGRPAHFPLEPMKTWQQACNSACL